MSEALLRALCQGDPRRRRFEMDRVWAAFAQAHPADAEGPDARRTLAAQIDALVAAGRLIVPVSRTHWDRSAQPALPRFVRLDTPARERSTRPDAPAWAPELRFARELTSPAQLELLRAVQRFLKQGGRERDRVPERERSLELFGDEKRLEQLRRTQLFGPGRLSLDLLRCFSVSPPLVWERFDSDACDAIVLENHHTYWSFCEYARRSGRYAAVVYGAGNALCRSVESLSVVAERAEVERFEYFGDLDATGLRVARQSSELAMEVGVGPLIPSPYYADLLRFPPRPGGKRACAREDLAWLPAALRSKVARATANGERWPQEYIGSDHLAGSPSALP